MKDKHLNVYPIKYWVAQHISCARTRTLMICALKISDVKHIVLLTIIVTRTKPMRKRVLLYFPKIHQAIYQENKTPEISIKKFVEF